jgi:hypothetical protein
MSPTPDWIGWLATATFLASYACKDPRRLRRIQGVAALLWAGYGAILHAAPIVIANLLVAGIAIYSSFGSTKEGRHLEPLSGGVVSSANEPGLSRISSPYS